MVGATGNGGFPRTAPTDQSSLADPLVVLSDSFGSFRGCEFSGNGSDAVKQSSPFSGGAFGIAGTSVESGHTVSSAHTQRTIDVEQPALPSDATGARVGQLLA